MNTKDAMVYFAVRHKPICCPRDIPEQWKPKLQLEPPSPSWKEEIQNRPWARDYNGPEPLDKKLLVLRDRLLSFAGNEAVIPKIEEDINDILEFGQLWNGWSNVLLKKGKPCRCHQNSADLYLANQDMENLAVATGYALSQDGLWRQHSWLLLRKPRSVRVIETTTKRLLYFGVALAEDSLARFLYYNT